MSSNEPAPPKTVTQYLIPPVGFPPAGHYIQPEQRRRAAAARGGRALAAAARGGGGSEKESWANFSLS